jgi:hypothetical protein
MADWLSDWRKRIKLTADATKVDKDLPGYQMRITLISSGNTAGIFDELASVSGTQKIAVTTADNTTQCYVEIEDWDWNENRATLWALVPTVYSGTNTDFYLYYDYTKDDNTTYIGTTGSSAAQAVWDSDFAAVWHMAQDPSGGSGAILDSTSNAHNLTSAGSMTSDDLIYGQTGKALNFDGTDDYLDVGTKLCSNKDTMTFESVVKTKSILSSSSICLYREDNAGWSGHGIEFTIYENDLKPRIVMCNGYPPAPPVTAASEATVTGTWYYIAGTYDRTGDAVIYTNGIEKGRGAQTGASVTSDYNGKIAWYYNTTGTQDYNDIIISDTRISMTLRDPAWIKTNYYNTFDQLLIYGEEELVQRYYYEGYITERGTPVSRQVRLYNRTTGELEDSTTSSGINGYYHLSTVVSGTHFIVAFDDVAGEEYNALILDKLPPIGTEYEL